MGIETSFKDVQEFDLDGQIVRVVNLGCVEDEIQLDPEALRLFLQKLQIEKGELPITIVFDNRNFPQRILDVFTSQTEGLDKAEAINYVLTRIRYLYATAITFYDQKLICVFPKYLIIFSGIFTKDLEILLKHELGHLSDSTLSIKDGQNKNLLYKFLQAALVITPIVSFYYGAKEVSNIIKQSLDPLYIDDVLISDLRSLGLKFFGIGILGLVGIKIYHSTQIESVAVNAQKINVGRLLIAKRPKTLLEKLKKIGVKN